MPFALLILGILLLVAGVRNTQDVLFALFKGDFVGQDNFIFWFLAIVLIGALGYIPKLKPISTAFLGLVIVVLFLKKGSSSGTGGGFFAQFTQAISGTQNAATPGVSTVSPLPLGNVGGTSGPLAANAQTQNILGQLKNMLQQDEQNLASVTP
jgi:hypothetical protein